MKSEIRKLLEPIQGGDKARDKLAEAICNKVVERLEGLKHDPYETIDMISLKDGTLRILLNNRINRIQEEIERWK